MEWFIAPFFWLAGIALGYQWHHYEEWRERREAQRRWLRIWEQVRDAVNETEQAEARGDGRCN